MIIVDKRIPEEAKMQLRNYDKLVELFSEGIVEESVSGHPDIFITAVDKQLVLAPQTPQNVIDALDKEEKNYVFGKTILSKTYPQIAAYNAVVTDNYLIHKLSITDEVLRDMCKDKIAINVAQGFTRCSLIALPNNLFITSDKGIEKALKQAKLEVLYINPKGIVLPGQRHGFVGGCVGFDKDTLFVIGNLSYDKETLKLKDFLSLHSIKYMEIYDGALFDGGSIVFV